MHDFSLDHYKEIMNQITINGYKCMFFHEEYKGKQVLVRHDIDMNIESALLLSKIEKECNVKSTYYVLINSPFYNIFEKENLKGLKSILENGHEIGLHFDETAYVINNKSDILKYIEKEVELLKYALDIDVKSVSFHRPSKYVLDKNLDLGKYINTYSNKFFKEYKYISDSNGFWREGCGCSIFKTGEFNKIQLLTHAFWWNSKGRNPDERLVDFVGYKLNRLENNLDLNVKRYSIGNFEQGNDVKW